MEVIDISWRRIDRDISQSRFCNIWPGVASWKEKVRPFAGMTRIRFEGSPRRLLGCAVSQLPAGAPLGTPLI
jgi:hypothetical protein